MSRCFYRKTSMKEAAPTLFLSMFYTTSINAPWVAESFNQPKAWKANP